MKYLTITVLSLLVVLPGFAATTGEESAVEETAAATTAESAGEVSITEEEAAELGARTFLDFDAIGNHYKCYSVQPIFGQIFPSVRLSDQFKQSEARVIRPRYLCNPVKKNNTGIINEKLHYVCFEILQDFEPFLPDVLTSNQFGTQFLRPQQTELLCLPSKKEHL